MECVVCQEEITQPLCPACVRQQVGVWLSEVSPKLWTQVPEVTVLDINFDNTCIRCHNSFSMCPYCYTADLLEWISTVAPMLKEEFLDFFNFDLGYGGYLASHRH